MPREHQVKTPLRDRLIEAAEGIINSEGVHALKARPLAERAGCALGAVYTVFPDLDALILTVNTRTLERIDEVMRKALGTSEDIEGQFHALALAYLDFAKANPHAWRALFAFQLPSSEALPDWFSAALLRLLSRIAEPLHRLRPDLDEMQLATRARSLFAAVHGLVSISLDNRFVGLPNDLLRAELDQMVRTLVAGLLAFPKTG